MKLSDYITQSILNLLEEDGGEVTLQRNDFANRIGCVPSQISYVLTSRFTPELGFIVESHRGGGGCIKITRVSSDKTSLIMHTLNSLGNSIDYQSERVIISNLCYTGSIDKKTGILILAASGDNALRGVPAEKRDTVRCSILKNSLLTAVNL